MYFERIEYLWLLAFLPALWFFLNRYLNTARDTMEVLGHTKRRGLRSHQSLSILVGTSATLLFTCLVVALAEPSMNQVARSPRFAGTNVIFLLDSSPSMNAQDIWPSRMEQAKNTMRKFVEADSGNARFALIAFSESSVILSHLTSDIQNLLFYLDFLQTDRRIIYGTDISAALLSGLRVVEKNRNRAPTESRPEERMVMVLISDGEDHSEYLEDVLEQVREQGVPVHCVAVGTPEGAIVPVIIDGKQDYLRDENGVFLRSKAQPQTLQMVARQTGGKFFQASSGLQLQAALKSILGVDPIVIGYDLASRRRSLYAPFLALALFFQAVLMLLRF
ncbi:MAG: VWA domain-containing protein [Acidobacteria bacterium]|nr:VWA domain-containing protein [Acidobacteriota bacterium]